MLCLPGVDKLTDEDKAEILKIVDGLIGSTSGQLAALYGTV